MAIPADTARTEADRVQIELLRASGSVRRFSRARSLSATVISLSRQAIRKRHPEFSNEQVSLRFVEIHYGNDLAERVRADLARRSA